jgi:hypothetical protein
MNSLDQFARKKYLNLETFRKTGLGVKTPVWFVQDSEQIFVTTMPGSGKVKRIRNNGRANVAPCRMNGALTGAWVAAEVRLVADPETQQRVNQLLARKYGLIKKLLDRQRGHLSAAMTVLEINLQDRPGAMPSSSSGFSSP